MKRVYIETYGCTLNQSDSELIAGLLKDSGFEIVDTVGQSDVVVINTCVVKKPTEDKVIYRIKELRELKPVVIAGCLAQAEPDRFKGISKIGTDQITHIAEVVMATIEGNVVTAVAPENNPRLCLPKIRQNKFIEIIPICKGCLGSCSYCMTKFARGNLVSYSKEDIVKQARLAIADGVKEIWLTSQDCGAYGLDIGTNLPALLRELCKLEGDYKIRVGMMNPNHVLGFLDELVEAFMSKRIFSFIHIPVQSGSDRILKLMNRKYTSDDFKRIVNTFRQEFKEMSISTDIICGFPGETKDDFEKTLNLVRDMKFDVVNISRYWKMPGTKAAKMKQIPPAVAKQRSTLLAAEFDKLVMTKNRDWLNWRGPVLITEAGTLVNSWIGKNLAYKQVVVLSEEPLLGRVVEVKIVDIGKHDLRGKLI